MADAEYLFVYGTLRAGFAHPPHRILRRYAAIIGPALMHGKLFEIDGYPGAIYRRRGKVVGELYRLKAPKPLFTLLDIYEECAPHFPQPHEYLRRKVVVTLKRGPIKAWVYLYNRPFHNRYPIRHGDYLTGRLGRKRRFFNHFLLHSTKRQRDTE